MHCANILMILVWLIPWAARSEIIYFRPDEPLSAGLGLSFPPDRPDDSLDLDLNFDGIFDINLKGRIQSEFLSFTYGNTLVLGRPAVSPNAGIYQIPLKIGDFIGENPSIDWWSGTDIGWGTGLYGNLFHSFQAVGDQVLGIGFWQDISPLSFNGYLGVQFEIEENIHYGWVYIRAGGNTGVIDEWAYETTPGVGIVAGAIPEPSSVGLVMLGGGAIWLARRRRHNLEENQPFRRPFRHKRGNNL